MSQPLITVLMTVFNGGRYLKSSLESILNQTFPDFELLVIDDGSSDETLPILRSFRDDRIVVHTHEKNLGQTPSLNIGLRRARGQYVARMDADDIAFPEWLEHLQAFVKKNPEPAVVSVKAAVIDPANRIVKILNTSLAWQEIVLKSLTFSPINHVGSLMQKDIILKVGGYDEQYHVPADFHLWSRLLRQGYRLATLPKVLMAIRFHEQSVSTSERGKRDREEMTRIIFENIQQLTSYPIREREAALLYQGTYEVERLDLQQIHEVLTVMEQVYRHLKPSLGIEPLWAKRKIGDQRTTIYMKRIFSYIQNGNRKNVRLLIKDYIRGQGWCHVFTVVWLISFGGTVFLRILPMVYEWLSRLFTKWKLWGQSVPKFIH